MATKVKSKELLEAFEEMRVLELSEFLKAFEEKFDVTAAAPVAVVAAPAGGGDGEAAAEEKDDYDVMLTEVGQKKVQVIKEVRNLTSLGLKEAKTLVDGAPASFPAGVDKEAAEKAREARECAGATGESR